MALRQIKVLVVDDSPTIGSLLSYILASDPEISIVGLAHSGPEAIEALGRMRPDVVTMDINMPGMNGYETTRHIMETTPVPIVIVSASYNIGQSEQTFRALEAGAVAVLETPSATIDSSRPEAARKLLETVKLMSEVKVIRRWPRRENVSPDTASSPNLTAQAPPVHIEKAGP